jgi:hypothetical protein
VPHKKPATRKQEAKLRKETLSYVICLMVQQNFFTCNVGRQTGKKTCIYGTQNSEFSLALKELIYYHNICIDRLMKTVKP